MMQKKIAIKTFLITLEDNVGYEKTEKTEQATFQEAVRVAYIMRASNNFKFNIKSVVEVE